MKPQNGYVSAHLYIHITKLQTDTYITYTFVCRQHNHSPSIHSLSYSSLAATEAPDTALRITEEGEQVTVGISKQPHTLTIKPPPSLL